MKHQHKSFRKPSFKSNSATIPKNHNTSSGTNVLHYYSASLNIKQEFRQMAKKHTVNVIFANLESSDRGTAFHWSVSGEGMHISSFVMDWKRYTDKLV